MLAAEDTDYATIKVALIKRFENESSREEIIVQSLKAYLNPFDILVSLEEAYKLYQKANLDEIARYGLLRKAVDEQIIVSQFALYRVAKFYNELKYILKDIAAGVLLPGSCCIISGCRNEKTFNKNYQAKL